MNSVVKGLLLTVAITLNNVLAAPIILTPPSGAKGD